MELSEFLNVVLGGSLVATIVSIVTIRSALEKARAEAKKALAEADKARAETDTVRITNTEQATRILIQNIVEPLKQELNETRKELGALKREVARFRKAVDSANSCRYSAGCVVLQRLREQPKERDEIKPGTGSGEHSHGQRDSPVGRGRKRVCRGEDNAGDSAEVGGEPDDTDGEPP